ncbi:UNVERIFIED_ORG: MFS family permease [Arthrobacter sp. UYEF10]
MLRRQARLIHGIAVGGEWGGAALMALEHTPKKNRGFATSFATAGGPAGTILATQALSAAEKGCHPPGSRAAAW